MKPIRKMTQAELAAYVQSHLSEKGIEVVLSGGAAVTIYTAGKYVSHDIDLVNRYSIQRSAIKGVMEALGFEEVGRHFQHPDSEIILEFPPGPLSLGEEEIADIHEVPLETGMLRVISPTSCVKDRLAWYYHNGDQQALSQAILVARDNKIDINNIEAWSEAEGKQMEFDEIKADLRG